MSVTAPTWQESRFLDRLWVDDVVIGAPGDCWTWNAAHDDAGYARCGKRLAHRLTAALCNRDAPHLHHRCQNRGCINPEHLEPLQTQAAHTERHVQLRDTCRHGHSYDEANLSVHAKRHRRCRTCNRERQRIYDARSRGLIRSLA